jgi:leucyl-tRNA synthetase
MRSERPFTSFFDRAFDNEINTLVEETTIHYDATNYKSALKTGLFDFQNARNWYRDVAGRNVHRDLVFRFIETQALLIAPIAPHWSEYIWRDVLKNVPPFPKISN